MRRDMKQIIDPEPVIEGAGVRLKRSIGTPTLDYLDPFLLFDDFTSGDPMDYPIWISSSLGTPRSSIPSNEGTQPSPTCSKGRRTFNMRIDRKDRFRTRVSSSLMTAMRWP